jgi:hypothetical protein
METSIEADVFSKSSLFKVPCVARIPIFLVLVTSPAGLIAGSIPIKGTVYFSRKKAIALVVAVLQATTIILAFLLSRNSVFLR